MTVPTIHIQVVNESTVLIDDQVKQCLEALQLQCSRDFYPAYSLWAELYFVPKGQKPDPTHWELVFADDSDQVGALGYHETTVNNDPIGFVFVKTAEEDGLSWTVTASHELIEMLGNPGISAVKEEDHADGSMTFRFKELCDACEGDEFGYKITISDGTEILVSDFVLPHYWDPISPAGTKLDFCGKITKPFEILTDGYLAVLEVPKDLQWQQINARKEVGGGKPIRPFNRRARHLIAKENWQKSER
jgi:hypothetical protein